MQCVHFCCFNLEVRRGNLVVIYLLGIDQLHACLDSVDDVLFLQRRDIDIFNDHQELLLQVLSHIFVDHVQLRIQG